MSRFYESFKRVADVAAASVVIALALPVVVPIVIGLRLTGEGEVFYRQRRVGHRRRQFGILKFATMLKNSPSMGTGDITLRNDPRVTPMGGFLRKTKLNELPQVLNVVAGDLSLVGPRPLMPVSFEMYDPEVQRVVYDSRPGITGLGSVVYRDEEALVSAAVDAGIDGRAYYRRAIYPYKGQLELYYRAHRGLLFDLRILVATAISVILPGVDVTRQLFPDLPPRPAVLEPATFLSLYGPSASSSKTQP